MADVSAYRRVAYDVRINFVERLCEEHARNLQGVVAERDALQAELASIAARLEQVFLPHEKRMHEAIDELHRLHLRSTPEQLAKAAIPERAHIDALIAEQIGRRRALLVPLRASDKELRRLRQALPADVWRSTPGDGRQRLAETPSCMPSPLSAHTASANSLAKSYTSGSSAAELLSLSVGSECATNASLWSRSPKWSPKMGDRSFGGGGPGSPEAASAALGEHPGAGVLGAPRFGQVDGDADVEDGFSFCAAASCKTSSSVDFTSQPLVVPGSAVVD